MFILMTFSFLTTIIIPQEAVREKHFKKKKQTVDFQIKVELIFK